MRRWCARIGAGLALLVALRLLWLAGQIVRTGRMDEAAPADAVVVLGAAVAHQGPSAVFAARLDHAVALFQRGLAPRLLLTGGVGEGALLSEAEVGRRYVVDRGIPADAVLVETMSRTTRGNLVGAAGLLQEHGWTRIILVSDPYHLYRAAQMARDLGLEPLVSPTPTTRYRSWRTRLPFLLREVYFVHQYQIVGVSPLEDAWFR
jgi:uncharacterized SAM-binding protein YcdF (DUF218 family)